MITKRNADTKTQSQPDGKGLTGHVAWVTGASRGIGRAIALALAESGATVAASARNSELLASLSHEISALGSPHHTGKADVLSEASLHSFAQDIRKRFGKIDILVNNAGIYRTEPVRGHSQSVWQEVIDTNLTSVLLTSRLVVDAMIESGWGRIVNIASISGIRAEMWGSAYSASKFGVVGFTQALALEVARHGITVNAVCPGWVRTDMSNEQLTSESWCKLNDFEPDQSPEIARLSVPQERFVEPHEVGALVAFLCREEARSVTGQAINICGGLSLT